MVKKSKKITKTKVNKVVAKKKVTAKTSNAPVAFLFRRFDNNIAFTLMVSAAAYAIFMMVNMVLQRTDMAIYRQQQQVAAMYDNYVGQVAGISDTKE